VQFFGESSVDYCIAATGIEQEVEWPGSIDRNGDDNHRVGHYPEPDFQGLLAAAKSKDGETQAEANGGEKSTGNLK
jgi:hypothetical protein